MALLYYFLKDFTNPLRYFLAAPGKQWFIENNNINKNLPSNSNFSFTEHSIPNPILSSLKLVSYVASGYSK